MAKSLIRILGDIRVWHKSSSCSNNFAFLVFFFGRWITISRRGLKTVPVSFAWVSSSDSSLKSGQISITFWTVHTLSRKNSGVNLRNFCIFLGAEYSTFVPLSPSKILTALPKPLLAFRLPLKLEDSADVSWDTGSQGMLSFCNVRESKLSLTRLQWDTSQGNRCHCTDGMSLLWNANDQQRTVSFGGNNHKGVTFLGTKVQKLSRSQLNQKTWRIPFRVRRIH